MANDSICASALNAFALAVMGTTVGYWFGIGPTFEHYSGIRLHKIPRGTFTAFGFLSVLDTLSRIIHKVIGW